MLEKLQIGRVRQLQPVQFGREVDGDASIDGNSEDSGGPRRLHALGVAEPGGHKGDTR